MIHERSALDIRPALALARLPPVRRRLLVAMATATEGPTETAPGGWSLALALAAAVAIVAAVA